MRILEVNGIAKEGRYDVREVKRAIDQECNKMFRFLRYENMQNEGDVATSALSLGHFNDLTVSDNAARPRRKSSVPFDIPFVDLPKGRGVHRVELVNVDGTIVDAVPVPTGSFGLLSGKVLEAMQAMWSYEVTRGRIFFNERYISNAWVTPVSLGFTLANISAVVVEPTQAGDSSPYPVPAQFVTDIIQNVVRILAPGLEMELVGRQREERTPKAF